jgi:hypothetical protein
MSKAALPSTALRCCELTARNLLFVGENKVTTDLRVVDKISGMLKFHSSN